MEGYLEIAKFLPAAPSVDIAAFEIGAVGWGAWPSRIIDLAGLITPSAVGLPPEEVICRERPAYIALRTDLAGDFLRRAGTGTCWGRNYGLVTRVADPNAGREFQVYARTDGLFPVDSLSAHDSRDDDR